MTTSPRFEYSRDNILDIQIRRLGLQIDGPYIDNSTKQYSFEIPKVFPQLAGSVVTELLDTPANVLDTIYTFNFDALDVYQRRHIYSVEFLTPLEIYANVKFESQFVLNSLFCIYNRHFYKAHPVAFAQYSRPVLY